MEIRKVLKGKYLFVNNARSNRSGFVHETTLFGKNGYKIAENKHQYYNRTWECYTYQSVMKNCVYNLIAEKRNRYIRRYKEENNIKRLVAKTKETILKDFEKLQDIKELRKIYKELDSWA